MCYAFCKLSATDGMYVCMFFYLKTLHKRIHIHAYELMLGLHVFRHTGPPRRVDCLAPPSVCHIKDETTTNCFAKKAHQMAANLIQIEFGVVWHLMGLKLDPLQLPTTRSRSFAEY